MNRNAATKNIATLTLSPMSVVKIKLTGTARTNSKNGKPSASGLTASRLPAAAIRK